MKTQIITLESHDDLISVRDRLSWAKTPRILLVWPKYEKISLRLLDLKVLQRQAASLGAQLGLVTRRANVRRDAESLGIPVFDSASDAQRDLWPETSRRRRRVRRPPRRDLRLRRDSLYPKASSTSLAGRVVIFAVGVTAVLSVAGLFVPRAAVTLHPESQVQSIVIPVTASTSISSISLTGSVPAQRVSVVVSRKESMSVGSQISVPKTKAKGVVRFTNLSQSELVIPAGTVVFATGASAVRFVTVQETRLAAGVDQIVEVPIEAVLAGAQGNMEEGQIAAVEGPLGLSLSVTNPAPTSGGSDSRELGATEKDRARLRDTLLKNLEREAKTQIRALLTRGDLLLTDTFELSQIAEAVYSPSEGQPGKQLDLTMKAEFSASYVSEDDLNQLTLASLDASVPAGFVSSSVPAFEPANLPVTDANGVTHFDLQATRTLLHRVETPRVFALTRGLVPGSARAKLAANFSLREPAEIKLSPSWWPWMPLIPFNIAVEVE